MRRLAGCGGDRDAGHGRGRPDRGGARPAGRRSAGSGGSVALREREHGIALCDVQLFALQRLVMLHARDAPVDEELDRDGMVQLLTALIAVPGTVLSPAEFGLGLPLDTDAPADPADDVWLRFFVGTGAMTTHGSFDHSIARARLLYQVIAVRPRRESRRTTARSTSGCAARTTASVSRSCRRSASRCSPGSTRR